MFEIFKLAASAALGMLAAFSVQWIKSGRDELRSICDEFCKVMGEAADTASQYWLKSGNDEQVPLLEARLMGFQARLTGLRVLTSEWFRAEDDDEVSAMIGDLFDTLTGGEFKTPGRPPDPARCQAAQIAAAKSMVSIRRAYSRSVRSSALIARWTAPVRSGASRLPHLYNASAKRVAETRRQLAKYLPNRGS